MPPSNVLRFLSAAVTVLLLLGFCAVYGFLFYKLKTQGWDYEATAQLGYFGTILTGFVGGIVARAFGVEVEDEIAPGRVRRAIRALSAYCTARPIQLASKSRDWIGTAFIILYFVVGAAAIAVWMFAPNTPEPSSAVLMVRNLAHLVFGMFIAIGTAFMRGQVPGPSESAGDAPA